MVAVSGSPVPQFQKTLPDVCSAFSEGRRGLDRLISSSTSPSTLASLPIVALLLHGIEPNSDYQKVLKKESAKSTCEKEENKKFKFEPSIEGD